MTDASSGDERNSTLFELERHLETPMLVLSFLWLVLVVLEATYHAFPYLEPAIYALWAVFVIEFTVRFSIAENKKGFIKANFLTLLSLVVPALRLLRAAKFLILLRAARGLRLLTVVGAFNRGMRGLRRILGRSGLPYVVLLTIMVTFLGAAGMYAFETEKMQSYGGALWWTAMIMTTMGSEKWPVTTEGRILCVLLAVYAFSIFGYVTASIARILVDEDRRSAEKEKTGEKEGGAE